MERGCGSLRRVGPGLRAHWLRVRARGAETTTSHSTAHKHIRCVIMYLAMLCRNIQDKQIHCINLRTY